MLGFRHVRFTLDDSASGLAFLKKKPKSYSLAPFFAAPSFDGR
jgi:hypothetical protein